MTCQMSYFRTELILVEILSFVIRKYFGKLCASGFWYTACNKHYVERSVDIESNHRNGTGDYKNRLRILE